MSNLIKKLESELKNSKLFLDLNPLKALWFIPAEFAKSPCSEGELTKRNFSKNCPILKINHWKKLERRINFLNKNTKHLFLFKEN